MGRVYREEFFRRVSPERARIEVLGLAAIIEALEELTKDLEPSDAEGLATLKENTAEISDDPIQPQGRIGYLRFHPEFEHSWLVQEAEGGWRAIDSKYPDWYAAEDYPHAEFNPLALNRAHGTALSENTNVDSAPLPGRVGYLRFYRVGYLRFYNDGPRRRMVREVAGGWTVYDDGDDPTFRANDFPDAKFTPLPIYDEVDKLRDDLVADVIRLTGERDDLAAEVERLRGSVARFERALDDDSRTVGLSVVNDRSDTFEQVIELIEKRL